MKSLGTMLGNIFGAFLALALTAALGLGGYIAAKRFAVLFSRLDFTVALVRGAGLEAEAQARAGEILGLLDESKIPSDLHGYVAVALERGLIDTIDTDAGPIFDPKDDVPRVAAARFLLRLLELK